MKRNSFILFEVLIAGVLTVILIAICCGAMRIFQKTIHNTEKKIEERQLSQRQVAALRHVLGQITRGKEDPFQLDPAAGNIAERLLFVFDNGYHANAQRNGVVLAVLYVNKDHELVLVTRAHPTRKQLKQTEEYATVLWRNVESISWRFALSPNDPDEKTGKVDKDWQTIWPDSWKGLPAVIQAIVQEKGRESPTKITSVILSELGTIQAKEN